MQDLPVHHSLVLSPQTLAQDVMAIHQEALDKYKSMQSSFGAP